MATRPDVVRFRESGPQVTAPAHVAFANDNAAVDPSPLSDPAWTRYASALPADARAIIEPDPLDGRSGGRARAGLWRLRLRERRPPFADPLTGWTGGCDPLAHLILRFPSREAAERYCRRYGLPFEVRRPPGRATRKMPPGRRALGNPLPERRETTRDEMIEGR